MSLKIISPLGGEINIGKDQPKDWIPIDISKGSRTPSIEEMQGAKRYLRKHKIQVQKYFLDVGENISLNVRRKDVAKTLKLLKHKKLKDLI